jgi:general secretion pathway protein G
MIGALTRTFGGPRTYSAARRSAHGFTLVELVVTVALIALIATMALPLSELTVRRTKEAELRRALIEIRDALDAYKRAGDEGRIVRRADESGFPADLQTLVQGVTDARDPQSRKIYFLRRVPRDPFHLDPTAPPETTWGLRSYESPASEPRPGKDVFDVFSNAQGTGLNGVPYAQW